MLSFKIPKEKQSMFHQKGLVGLDNIGNTCYLNAIIQCLSKTPHFSKIFLTGLWEKHINESKKEREFVISLRNLVNGMWGEEGQIIRPITLLDLVKRNVPSFDGYGQQDAQEVLTYIIDALHTGFSKEVNIDISGRPKNHLEKLQIKRMEEFKKQYKNCYSIILDLFYGWLISEIKTVDGKQDSYSFTPFSIFPVPIKEKSIGTLTLEECLDKFGEREILTGDNKWYSDETKEYHDSYKKITIFQLPNIMVIMLKRFDPLTRRKLSTLVKFPLTIDFQKHIYHQDLIDDQSDSIYSLYAVCNHIGDTYGGHYFSYCKMPTTNKWYEFDDTKVKEIGQDDLVTPNAYILFYCKKKYTI